MYLITQWCFLREKYINGGNSSFQELSLDSTSKNLGENNTKNMLFMLDKLRQSLESQIVGLITTSTFKELNNDFLLYFSHSMLLICLLNINNPRI